MKNCSLEKSKRFFYPKPWIKVCACFIFIWLMMGSQFSSFAQTAPKRTHILLMLDCSGSMHDFIEGTKVERMTVAKKLLIQMVDSLKALGTVDLALHTYGDRFRERNCKDTRLAVYFQPDNFDLIKNELKKLEPKGTTPIANSLIMAQHEFPSDKGQNYIILITDGYEECQGDPCAVSRTLQEKGIVLKPFIIGIGLTDNNIQSLNCIGRVYNTRTEKDLGEILNMVVSQAMNNTTVQVNLNNAKGQAKETDVNMIFYNSRTHEVATNYFHTMNVAGVPDTFKLDPVIKYDLQVSTTPPIIKKGIELKAARHNIINVDASQGNLQLNAKTGVKCMVREDHTTDIIYIQDAGTVHRYLSGLYDLEMLTLPRIVYKGIKIEENQVKKIDVPAPGRADLNFSRDMVGSIFTYTNGTVDWVVDIDGNSKVKEGYDLQPGTYRIICRAKSSKQTEESLVKEFVITSGSKISIDLNK